jgi:hypothetical protein
MMLVAINMPANRPLCTNGFALSGVFCLFRRRAGVEKPGHRSNDLGWREWLRE